MTICVTILTAIATISSVAGVAGHPGDMGMKVIADAIKKAEMPQARAE